MGHHHLLIAPSLPCTAGLASFPLSAHQDLPASLPAAFAGVFGRACNCVGSDGAAKEGVIQEAERLRETLVEKLADIRSSTAATAGDGDSGQCDATVWLWGWPCCLLSMCWCR